MIPEGAEPWRSKMGENLTITVEQEGAIHMNATNLGNRVRAGGV